MSQPTGKSGKGHYVLIARVPLGVQKGFATTFLSYVPSGLKKQVRSNDIQKNSLILSTACAWKVKRRGGFGHCARLNTWQLLQQPPIKAITRYQGTKSRRRRLWEFQWFGSNKHCAHLTEIQEVTRGMHCFCDSCRSAIKVATVPFPALDMESEPLVIVEPTPGCEATSSWFKDWMSLTLASEFLGSTSMASERPKRHRYLGIVPECIYSILSIWEVRWSPDLIVGLSAMSIDWPGIVVNGSASWKIPLIQSISFELSTLIDGQLWSTISKPSVSNYQPFINH